MTGEEFDRIIVTAFRVGILETQLHEYRGTKREPKMLRELAVARRDLSELRKEFVTE